MKTVLLLLPCLLVFPSLAHSQSADSVLEEVASLLTSKVKNGQAVSFVESFNSGSVASQINYLARGQLFTDPFARRSFQVTALPGAVYLGPANAPSVFGRLQMKIYDPNQNNLRSYAFDIHAEHVGNLWKITSMQSVPFNEQTLFSPSNGSLQRKSLRHNDDWMWSTGYGKK